jgi:MSHA pilin protein MshD
MQGRCRTSWHRARGVTLVELVVTIVIVSIAVTGVVSALSANAVQSANRIVQQQATAVASAYLQEVMQKPFGPRPYTGPVRALFDDIGDYNGHNDNVVRDQQGAAVAGLGQYQVGIQVGAAALAGIPGGAVRLITVTVRHSTGLVVVTSGYKTNHPPP